MRLWLKITPAYFCWLSSLGAEDSSPKNGVNGSRASPAKRKRRWEKGEQGEG